MNFIQRIGICCVVIALARPLIAAMSGSAMALFVFGLALYAFVGSVIEIRRK